MIAACLLTCDRLAYTAQTLASFARVNDLSRFTLLHGDDASLDAAVPTLARDYGFETVVRPRTRQGWLPMRRQLFQAAAARGADWIVFLENDIEWVRAFPWPLFEFVARQAEIYCLRLHGDFKDRAHTQPCLAYHKSDRTRPVAWKPMKFAPEKAQVTRIHWSAQPSATRVDELIALHEYGMESEKLTARVLENVTYHIGALRTHELSALMPLEAAS